MRMVNPFLLKLFPIAICFWLSACLTDNGGQAGRGTVVENEIAGVLVPSQGNSVSGARVTLFSADSLAANQEPI